MTQAPEAPPPSTVTTIQIRRGANIALSISYDSTDSVTSTLALPKTLRSLIDQAITQWWNGLTTSQRSVLSERQTSYKIQASFQNPPQKR